MIKLGIFNIKKFYIGSSFYKTHPKTRYKWVLTLCTTFNEQLTFMDYSDPSITKPRVPNFGARTASFPKNLDSSPDFDGLRVADIKFDT
jgi:hypothetical protein